MFVTSLSFNRPSRPSIGSQKPTGQSSHAVSPQPQPRFSGLQEFKADSFMEKEGDDWLCSVMNSAKKQAMGPQVTPNDFLLALVQDFQQDLGQHQKSPRPEKRYADSYLGIKMGMSQNPTFAQDQQKAIQHLEHLTQQWLRERDTQQVPERDRKAILNSELTDSLKNASLVFTEMKRRAPDLVSTDMPLADLDLVLQTMLKAGSPQVKSAVETIQKATRLSFGVPIERFIPEAIHNKPEAAASSPTADEPASYIPPAEREWLAYEQAAQQLCSTLLSRISEDRTGKTALNRPLSAFRTAASERLSKSHLFTRIVEAETAMALEEMLYGETTAATSKAAQSASKTALMMSGQYLMMENKIPLHGSTEDWASKPFPETVYRDVERLRQGAKSIANTLLNDYQDFLVDLATVALEKTPAHQRELVPEKAFTTALKAYEGQNAAIALGCVGKVKALWQETLTMAPQKTESNPFAGREEEV